jgi:Predicted secreted protein
MKKTVSIILCLLMILSLSASAWADAVLSRVVIGADLNPAQVESVYASFGLRRGDVPELSVTNAEERHYLEGLVSENVIGTRSISCVYVELLPPGSGISVSTSNITWCTGEMYVSALSTAGITDARILVAAPFQVSGTAALTGVYKAYEDMTGTRLDDTAKLVSTQELTITGDLAQQIGSMDSTSIVGELKLMLDQTKYMSDEEIHAVITEIANRYNVRLTDTQVSQLISLCRSLEGLNPDQLKERVEQMQGTLQKVSEAKNKVVSFAESVKSFIDSAGSFFEKLREFMDRFSGNH